MADSKHNTRAPVWTLFRDPALREVFRRASDDPREPQVARSPQPKPVLAGGAAKQMEVVDAG